MDDPFRSLAGYHLGREDIRTRADETETIARILSNYGYPALVTALSRRAENYRRKG